MERELFKQKMYELSDNERIHSDDMMLKSVEEMKSLYTDFSNKEESERLLNAIQFNLLSIIQCTKALRGTMTDIPYPKVYDQLPESGLRFSVIGIEELSELAYAITQKIHPSQDYVYEDGLQEFADVCICMDVIEKTLGIDPETNDLDKAIYVKSKRVLDSFIKDKTYK